MSGRVCGPIRNPIGSRMWPLGSDWYKRGSAWRTRSIQPSGKMTWVEVKSVAKSRPGNQKHFTNALSGGAGLISRYCIAIASVSDNRRQAAVQVFAFAQPNTDGQPHSAR